MNLSYWERAVFFKNIDVAVIGSGIVGLNAAIHLKENEPKLNVIILERGIFPSGASTRNAGFACFGSISELTDDLDKMGLETVLALVEKRWKGLQRLKSKVGAKALDFQEYGGYELFKKDDLIEPYLSKIELLNQSLKDIIGAPNIFQLTNHKIKDFGFQGVTNLVFNKSEGQIHTGKMMANLLQIAKDLKIPIYNGITVKELHQEDQHVVIETANNWRFKANKVIIATNGFTKKIFPDLAIQPARNQVLITKPIPNLNIQGTFHYEKGYYYFRNIDNRLLFGGGRNIALAEETTDEFGLTQLIQNNLVKVLNETILPNTSFEIESWWSGILGVGETKKPIVKMINERVAVAVRLSGMGVAIGSLLGEEAANLILE